MITQNPEELMKKKLIESANIISEKFKAIGHPVRMCILIHLLDKTDTFNNIMSEVGNSFTIGSSSLAHHLNSLEKEGLIQKIKRGEYELTNFTKQILNFINLNYNRENNKSEIPSIIPDEKLVSSNPVYQPGWNSFVSSLSGILNSLHVNYDYIEVGGRVGMSFPIIIETQTFDYKAIDAFNDKTFSLFLEAIESFGFKVNLWQKEKTYADNWQMNDEDFKKVQEMFNEVKNIICCFNTPVMLYGIRNSSVYGIVKGYRNDSYIVSTFYRSEGRIDTPVRFDSIFVSDIFRFLYLSKHESIPINQKPDYLEVLKRSLKLAKGKNITRPGFIAGPAAYDEWIKKLKEGQNTKHSYFGRHYHDARLITTEFLERIARNEKGKNQSEFLMLASREHRKVKQQLEEFMMLIPYWEPEKISFTNDIIDKSTKLLENAKLYELQAINYLEDAIQTWES